MSKKSKSLQDWLFVLLGTTLVAVGISFFIAPAQLVTGGVTGISIIVEFLTGAIFPVAVPIWLTNLIINAPLFIISIKQRGFDFGKKSLAAAGYLSFALWLTENIRNYMIANGSGINVIQSDYLLTAIFGGLILGAGLGLVLRASATTGGTDTLATILQYKFKSIPISKIILGLDSCIIIAGMFIFGIQKGMYALICVFVTSKTINTILEGVNYSKAVYIISDKSEEIAQELMTKLPRGVTRINAQGMYTKQDKNILFVVIAKNQVIKLKEIVTEIDNKAFLTITDAKEVFGEGFKQDSNQIS